MLPHMARHPTNIMDRAYDAYVNPDPPSPKPKSRKKPSVQAKEAGLPVKTSREYDNPPRKPPKERKSWMCTAHLADGSGRQCEQPRLYGQQVCGTHGGRSPQALKKARERLAKLIPEADRTLYDMLKQRAHLPTALNAAKEVYDRVEGPVKGGEKGSGIQVQVGFLMPKEIGGQPAVGVRVLTDGQSVEGDVVEEEE